jgi:hypothetical protein
MNSLKMYIEAIENEWYSTMWICGDNTSDASSLESIARLAKPEAGLRQTRPLLSMTSNLKGGLQATHVSNFLKKKSVGFAPQLANWLSQIRSTAS